MGFYTIFLSLSALSSVLALCPSGTLISSDDTCYSTIDSANDFNALEGSCTVTGGHLAYIANGFDNNIVKEELLNDQFATSEYYFIGLKRNCSNCPWRWTSGKESGYMNWGVGHPVDNYNCAVIDRIGATAGKWYSVDCTKSFPGLCSTPQIPPCQAGWTHLDSTKFCYKVFPGFKRTDAHRVCEQNNAVITSIHSSEENQFVTGLATNNSSQKDGGLSYMTWIGITYDGQKQSFLWDDGSVVNYTSWSHNGGQPKLSDGVCVADRVRMKRVALDWSWPRVRDRNMFGSPNTLASDFYFGSSVVYSIGDWFTYKCSSSQRVVVCKKPEGQA